MDIELRQRRRKILLFLSVLSLYIEALVPSFHKLLKTSSIKFFGLLSEPGGCWNSVTKPHDFRYSRTWTSNGSKSVSGNENNSAAKIKLFLWSLERSVQNELQNNRVVTDNVDCSENVCKSYLRYLGQSVNLSGVLSPYAIPTTL
jgi:hypothetical protein